MNKSIIDFGRIVSGVNKIMFHRLVPVGRKPGIIPLNSYELLRPILVGRRWTLNSNTASH